MPQPRAHIYNEYMTKVTLARRAGYSNKVIVEELMRERDSIMPRCVMKQATLATDRNIYKRREVARLAWECIKAIDQILEELKSKEIPA